MIKCLAADEATGCNALAALSARAASGELAAMQAQPHALSLCLPAITSILSSTLEHLSQSSKQPKATAQDKQQASGSGRITTGQQQTTVAQQWLAVAKILGDILHKEQFGQHLVPLIARCFALQHSTVVTHLCMGLLNHMPVLYDKVGLQMYSSQLHPILVQLIAAPDNFSPATSAQRSSQTASTTQAEIAASFERAQLVNAASTALCGMASSKLTLPVVLEHVIRPLLMALGNSPDIAVALIGLGNAIGGSMAALHLLPSLVVVLVSSDTDRVPSNLTGQTSSTGMTIVCMVGKHIRRCYDPQTVL